MSELTPQQIIEAFDGLSSSATPDRFLSEIRACHELRARLKGRTPAQLDQLARKLGGKFSAQDWIISARDAQLPPPNLDWCWIYCAGRGAGKTWAMSGAVHAAIRSGCKYLNLVAPTSADGLDVCVEGPSGILATCGSSERPRWVSTRRRLEWSNGAVLKVFSAEEPESLRGQQCEILIFDELARYREQQACWDMGQFGCRLGDKPRTFVATTPRPTPMMKKLLNMPAVSITRGTTYDNSRHLPRDFLERIEETYGGTRLGRQELLGELILEPQDALFKDAWIIRDLIPEEAIEQVTVGVDPAFGAEDATGIVVCALLKDGRYGVLADRTVDSSPGTWAAEVVRAHDDFGAEDVACESNKYGNPIVQSIKQAAELLYRDGQRSDDLIRVRATQATTSKGARAAPISLLYERGRVLHRRGLDALEGQMLTFSRDHNESRDGSPDRMDAMVHALTRLARIKTSIPIA